MKKIYFLIVMLVAFIAAQSQTTRRWVGPNNGSWATGTNWQVGATGPGGATGVPVAGDIIYLNTGTTITITNVPTIMLGSLIVTNNSGFTLAGPGGTQTLTIGNALAGDDLSIVAGSTLTQANSLENITIVNNNTANVAGTFNVNGTYNTNGTGVVTTVAGTIDNGGAVTSTAAAKLLINGTYIHDIDGGTVPTATWNAASNCNITGIAANDPAGLTQTFGNFTWNSNQSGDVNLEGTLQTINGNFTVSNTGGDHLRLTESTTFILNVAGDMLVSGANTELYFNYNVSNIDRNATINVAGNFSQTGGDIVFYRSNNDRAGVGTLDVAGNFTQSGGHIDYTSGTNAATGLRGRLLLAGNFVQSGAAVMETTSGDANVTNGTISFDKNGTQTLSVATPANIISVNFIVLANSTLQMLSNLGLSRNSTANYTGKFTVNANGVLDMSTFTMLSQVTAADASTNSPIFTLSDDAKLITANATGVSTNTTSSFNPTNFTRNFSSVAIYEFQGASTGTFTTVPTALTAKDIIINKTTGSVTMAQAMTVTNKLQLLSGELLTTTNVITVGAAGYATGSSGTANTYDNGSFVVGPIRAVRTNAAPNNTFTFPTGKTGVGLIPIAIAGINGNSTYEAEYISQPASARGSAAAAGLTQTDYCQYWELFKTTGTGSPTTVTLYWNANSKCSATPYVTAPASLRIGRSTGIGATPGWSASGGTATSVTPFTTGSISWTLAAATLPTTQTLYTLGSTLVTENPLPVTLANVSAFEKNSGVQVDWSNLTEKDVVDYEVERSLNGKDFTTVISKQAAKANQDARADYTAFDATPVQGANFYRIKVKETSGKVLYSKTLRVDIGSAKKGFSVYPNPVTGNQLNIGMVNLKQGKYRIQVINSGGQNIYQKNIVTQSNATTQTLQLPSSVKPGVYSMVVTGDDYRETKMFVVQ